MLWFANLKTATKLILFFTVMVVFLLLTAAGGVLAARMMNENQEATFEKDYKATVLVQNVAVERLKIARLVRDAIIEVDAAKSAGFWRSAQESAVVFDKLVVDADALVPDAESHAILAELRGALPEYMELGRRAVDASPTGSRVGDVPEMLRMLAAASDIGVKRMDAKISEIVSRSRDRAAARARDSAAQYRLIVGASVGVFCAIMLIGTFLTRAITRAIAVPLGDTVVALERLAGGDLTVKVNLDRTDEIGVLAKALNASIDAVRVTLLDVSEVSADVTTASNELASNAQAISAGAQQQAASLEETAASLEEISATVKQNTDNAQTAASLAESARDTAERGGEVVSAAVAAMEEITKSSKQIADIIATIDEIAFQTNLLALNAAVEAARAGEQGRGFAVVATEVRTLAQRTGAASKEIRDLIVDSSSKVEAGTNQVNESGRTLGEIVRSVKRVTDMVSEIAAASREQNAGLEQISTAMTQVDQVTQSNAAQTEELSATATSLSDKAHHLENRVSQFQLGAGARPDDKASAKVRSLPSRGLAVAPRRAQAESGARLRRVAGAR